MNPRLSKGFLAFLVVLSLARCKEAEAPKAEVSPEVNVVKAGLTNVNIYQECVGQTYGQSDVNIETRLEGWITGIYFKEGSNVQKGSLLYTIDDQPTKNQLDAAEANLARARTIMENKKADLDRVKPLTEMNALSQRDLDAAAAAYESTKEEVKIAEAQVQNSKIDLSYSRILAPVTGVIGISKVQVGDYVSRANLGAPINVVSSLGEVRVRFPIAESDYLRFVKRNEVDPVKQKLSNVVVELLLSDGSVYGEKGVMQLTNRQIDPTTGTILVQALFQNKDGLLRPGQYIKVRFRTDQLNQVVVVPQQAINQIQNIYQVYLLTDSNKIRPLNVKVGQRVGSNWVVTDGLKAGDPLVILGNAAITPSMTLTPKMISWNYDSTSKN